MIVLDTNVISAFMTSPPADSVLVWLNAQDAATLYLTTITIAEIGFGLESMPPGQRRQRLIEQFEHFIKTAFVSRVLPFDEAAARVYGEIRAHRRRQGQPMSNVDGQIAAIAKRQGFAIATRNTKDFQDCGITLINPFSVSRFSP